MGNLIKFDYHIHAQVLKTPSDAEAFVKKAIDAGLTAIGISDHAPLWKFPLGDRVPNGKTAEYCRAVRALAYKYRDKIEIKCGIEMDFVPGLESDIEEILSDGDFDYVIGSSHLHLPGMLPNPICEYTAQEYVELSLNNNISAVKSGYFDILAHVDMYRWIIDRQERFKLRTSDFKIDGEKLETLLSEMSKRGVALEINTNFMGASGDTSKIYPSDEIMAQAMKYPLIYSFGSDAHAPGRVGGGIPEVTATPRFAGCFDKFIRI